LLADPQPARRPRAVAGQPDHPRGAGRLVMAQRNSGVALVAGLIPALILTLVFSIILLGGRDADTMCLPGSQQPGVTIDPESVPDTPIAGYEHEQLVNAAYIMQAGKALGLSVRDQTIGVMTAMGESSLRVLDHGRSEERR